MKKIFFMTILVLCLGVPGAYAFSDLEPESKTEQAVSALAEAGVINGYEDGTFRPGNALTRAELCKMINILFNFTDVGHNDFYDVSYNDWYYTQVLTANAYQYIAGYEDGSFRGGNAVTREQASVIINRITPLLEIEQTMTITDEVSDWAREAVQMIANHKLLGVDEQGRFRAHDNITRGELAELLSRFIPKEKNDTYEDGTSGTNAEIAIENAVVLANLRAAVRDIESVEFNQNEQSIIDYTLIGLKGTIEAGMNGVLINKRYVILNYGKEITAARNIYQQMTDDQKGYFHNNLVKLNNSTLMFLQSYFLGDKPPV